MKRIEVAVGLLRNAAGQWLVAQRTVEDDYFAKWEFPGGKIEAGESETAALARELNEELGIEIGDCSSVMVLEHDYPDRQVRLHVLLVDSYQGQVHGREGQAIRWVTQQQIEQLDFLSGNTAIVDSLSEL